MLGGVIPSVRSCSNIQLSSAAQSQSQSIGSSGSTMDGRLEKETEGDDARLLSRSHPTGSSMLSEEGANGLSSRLYSDSSSRASLAVLPKKNGLKRDTSAMSLMSAPMASTAGKRLQPKLVSTKSAPTLRISGSQGTALPPLQHSKSAGFVLLQNA